MTKYSPISLPAQKRTLSAAAQESRVDALVRIMGILVLIFGAALVYFTYAESGVLSVQEPVLVPVYYVLGLALLLTGFLASFSRFK
jgi:hypothetical protein